MVVINSHRLKSVFSANHPQFSVFYRGEYTKKFLTFLTRSNFFARFIEGKNQDYLKKLTIALYNRTLKDEGLLIDCSSRDIRILTSFVDSCFTIPDVFLGTKFYNDYFQDFFELFVSIYDFIDEEQ